MPCAGAQYEGAGIQYEDSGAEIVELELTNENQELCDAIFTHDPSLVLNEGAVLLNMAKKLRQKETDEHANLYHSINIPILGRITNQGTVEGGDCLWLNEKTSELRRLPIWDATFLQLLGV